MNEHEDYKKYLEFCNNVALEIAKLFNLNKVRTKEGIHGFWTALSNIYLKELGTANKDEIVYYSDNSPYYVKNRNFWSDRAISIRKHKSKRSDHEIISELTISCSWYDDEPLSSEDDKEHNHFHLSGGKYRISQIHAFDGDESYQLVIKMHDIIQDMIKKYYEKESNEKLQNN